MEDFCVKIDCPLPVDKSLVKKVESDKSVSDCFLQTPDPFEDISSLFRFFVPDVEKDSLVCTKKLRKEQFNLTTVFTSKSFGLALYRCNLVIGHLHSKLQVDWIGIYLVSKAENALVKVAYRGAPSRPFFPLTKEFASGSSNSTVGMTGKIKIIQSVGDNTDGYYECDDRVKSECCIPILSEGRVIGIIDAESHSKDFFKEEIIMTLVHACYQLGNLIKIDEL